MPSLSYVVILCISLVLTGLTPLLPVSSQSSTGNVTTPITVEVYSPQTGYVMGLNGAGWVVDISLQASSAQYNSLLSASNGYKPAFLNPLNSTQFHAGNSSAAPGLVCLFNSSTFNFAGVFEINGYAMVNGGTIAQIWNTWYLAGASLAGQNILMTVYVVNGTAPSALATGTTILPNVISNVVTVSFSVSA